MTTALTIITRTLQELGVAEDGQSLPSEQTSKCLIALNALADSWLTAPNYAYATELISANLPASTTNLAIGPGLAFNVDRPIRLEGGCYIRSGNVDYPLDQITEPEYNAIPIKDLAGPWPQVCFYDANSPTGLIYFYPTGACTVYLNVLIRLEQFANLTTNYTLPPGYERAYALTLAEEVAPMFRTVVNPVTARNAASARRAIKRANFVVPQLSDRSIRTTEQVPFNDVNPFDGGSA